MVRSAQRLRSLAQLPHDEVLVGLVEVWRDERVPELGRLIIELSAEVSFEPIKERTKRATAERFVEIAAERNSADLPRLLAAFPVGGITSGIAQVKALEQWPDDPRISHKILGMFGDPPYRSRTSLDFWVRALCIVSKVADPQSRTAIGEITKTIEASFAVPMCDLLKAELEMHQDKFSVPPAANQELASVIEELRSTLLAKDSSSLADAEELLGQVYQQPLNDELRLVYADACLAAGDLRGEVIVIGSLRSLGKRITPQQRKQEKAVLASESSTWLGGLQRLLLTSSIKFRMGFLDAATIKPKHDSHVRSVIGDRRWSTVRSLEIKAVSDYHNEKSAGARDSVEELVCHPIMHSLRHLTGDLSPDLIEELCAGSRERALETLFLTAWKNWEDDFPNLLDKLTNATRLPQLRELITMQSHRIHPEHYDWLFSGELYTRLQRLEIRSQVTELPAWFTFFADSSLRQLAICDRWAHSRIELTHAEEGTGLSARFRYPGDVSHLIDFLSSLSVGAFHRIDVQWSRANAPSPALQDAVRSAVIRLSPNRSKLPT